MAWLLDIGLKKINNPALVTIQDIESSVKQWTADERMTVFLLVAKYIAADLIAQAEYEEGQLALKCLKSATSGKKISCSEMIKLASALDVGTEELGQVLQKLSLKEPNGTT